MNIYVLADDFTGANDVGLQLRKYGIKVVSLINPSSDVKADVKIIDSRSRNISEKRAYENVKRVIENINLGERGRLYKKIDSTIRGNIVKEIEALSEITKKDEKVIVVSAFPKAGRVVKNGKVYVDGEYIMETEFARDPIKPLFSGDFRDLIDGCAIVSFEEFVKLRGNLRGFEEKVIVIDSEKEEELDYIAKLLVKNSLDRYIVGSAGIMAYLPNYWNIKNDKILIVSGSFSEKNELQLKKLIESCDDIGVSNIDIYSGGIIEKESNFDNKRVLLLKTYNDIKSGRKNLEVALQKESQERINDFFVKSIKKSVLEIVLKYGINKIICAGGETSGAVMESLGIEAVEVMERVEDGVALLRDSESRYNIITKPGAFGSEEIFLNSLEVLRRGMKI